MISRSDAEKVIRKVLSNELGREFPPNLFKDSVDEFMKEQQAQQDAKNAWANTDTSISTTNKYE